MKRVKTNQMNARRCNSEGAGVKMTSWLNNNFKLLALTLLAVLSVNVVWGGDVNLTINATSVTSNGVTVTCANTSGTAPADQGDYIRLYANNTVTISSNSKNIVAMTIGWSKNPNKTYASANANCGEYNDPSSSGSTVVYGNWSGSSKTIVFTIASSGQKQIHSVEVTFEAAGPSCTTPPTVSAGSASDATTSSLTFNCSGGITSLGSAGCSITEYGYVYGTSENPTTSNTKHKVGESYTTTGTAFAAHTATGLNCGTTYYMRPYAINGNNTAYGARVSLATLDCPVDHFIDNVQGTAQQDKQGNGYTIPSCSDQSKGSGCEGEHYKFIGWSSERIQTGEATEPSGLLKAGETHNATGDTYYAVWAKEQ